MTVIESLMDRILAQLDRPSVEPSLKLQARDKLAEVRGDARLVSKDGGYEQFLLEYVKTEAERRKSDAIERDGFDERRTRPLCRCPNRGCDLKHGKVPYEIRSADTISQGIRQFEQEHQGRPVVLYDARQTWSDKIDRVEQTLMTINVSLTHGQEITDVES